MRKSKYVLILLSVLILGALGITGIYAYLTDADTAENKVTIGGNNIKIVEEFNPPSELKPGVSFTKNVKVSNEGPVDCFVRIKAVFSDSDMEKYSIVDWNVYDEDTNPDGDWIYNEEDGYYYYPDIIYAPVVSDGEEKEEEGKSISTTPLFENVTIKTYYDANGNGVQDEGEAIDSTVLKNFDILVYAESYQAYNTQTSENFESYEDAWAHFQRNKPSN